MVPNLVRHPLKASVVRGTRMRRWSTFTPPRHAAHAARCGLFLLRRSYRTLTSERGSVREVPDELWTRCHVLKRARERVLIVEARERENVREIVVSAMKSVLGLDPVSHLVFAMAKGFRRLRLDLTSGFVLPRLDSENHVASGIRKACSGAIPPKSSTIALKQPFGAINLSLVTLVRYAPKACSKQSMFSCWLTAAENGIRSVLFHVFPSLGVPNPAMYFLSVLESCSRHSRVL
jgi:hypothetical protein